MTVYSGRVSQLLQGVSEQPDHTRGEGQLTSQTNCIGDIMQGFRRRRGFRMHQVIGMLETYEHYTTYLWDRGDGLELYLLVVLADGTWHVFDLLTGEFAPAGGGTITSSVSSAASTYITADDPRNDLAFHTVGDTTFVLNKTVEAFTNVGAVDGLPDGVLIWSKRAPYGQIATLYDRGATVSTVTQPSIVTVDVSTPTASQVHKQIGPRPDSPMVIFKANLTTAGYTAERYNNVLYIDCSDPSPSCEPTDWRVDDGAGNADIVVILKQVKTVKDLPPYAPHGYKVEIIGEGGSDFDNYWVQFIKDDETLSSVYTGQWVECTAPNFVATLIQSTMPCKITRTWTGVTPTFTLDTIDWDPCTAGDWDTNPLPSFNAKKLTSINTYQHRLVLTSGENIHMSVAFEYYNFFANSVAAKSDDDPIDAASNDNQITNLLATTVFDGDLFVFSRNAQFIHSKDKTLKPSTFGLNAVARHPLVPTLNPIVSGRSILFPASAGDTLGIWETIADTVTGKPVTEQLNKHCETYIPNGGRVNHNISGDIVVNQPESIATHPSKGLTFIASGGDIYVLQLFYKDREKVQVAWHKWSVSKLAGYVGWKDDEERPTVSDVHIAGDKLYAIVRFDSEFSPRYNPYVVTMDLDLPSMSSAEPEEFLDLWYNVDSSDIAYSIPGWIVSDKTYHYKATLPLRKWEDAWFDTVLIRSTDDSIESNVPLDEYSWVDGTPNLIYFNMPSLIDTSKLSLRIGNVFESRARITKPYVKTGAGRAYVEDAVLDDLVFDLNNTAYVEFEVSNVAGDGYTHIMNGQILNYFQYNLGMANRVALSEPVSVCNDRALADIDVVSNHHHGFHIDGYTWHLTMHSTGRRSN